MKEIEGHTSGFEKQVLNAASNIPIDYNPEGWENLSKQLDADLPVIEPKISQSLKLWLISIGVSTVLVVLLFSTYPGRAMNTLNETNNKKLGPREEFQLEWTPSRHDQDNTSFPEDRDLENKLSKSKKYKNDSIKNVFSLEEQSRQKSKIDIGKKNDEVSKVKTDSTAIQFQPKQEEKDSIFIFW